MFDIHGISAALKKADDGIWYSTTEEPVSYPANGNACCFAVEDQSFWYKHRNACIVAAASAFPPVPAAPGKAAPMFDIGGGNGVVSFGLAGAGFDVVLVEPSRTGAANAKKRGIPNVICATTQAAQFKENSLPAAGMFDVLEHIEDDRGFLRSLHASLQDNGLLYLLVPAYNCLWSHGDNDSGHFRRYTLTSASSVLKSAGFEILYGTYIFRYLPLPFFLLRTIPYRLGLGRKKQTFTNQKVKNDYVVTNRLVVRVLDHLLAGEVKNIRDKKTMHVGGSCLLVARKKMP